MITTVIPLYNRRDLICESIDSVLSQDIAVPHEILIVDDGSTDDAASLLAETYGDKIRILRQSNRGVAAARNLGVSTATYGLVAFLDSDDLMLPGRLKAQYDFLIRHRSCCLVAANYCVFNGRLSKTNVPYFDHSAFGLSRNESGLVDYWVNSVRVGNPLVSTGMVRREYFIQAGRFDESMKRCEDFEFSGRMAAVGEIGIIDQCLVAVRNQGHARLSKQKLGEFEGPSAYEQMLDCWLTKHKLTVDAIDGFKRHVGRWASAVSMQYWGLGAIEEIDRVRMKYAEYLSPWEKTKALFAAYHRRLV